MPKKSKKSPAKKNPAKKHKKTTKEELVELAHEGTEESLGKIEKLVSESNNPELQGLAELAYTKSEFLHYFPKDEKEEKEFLIAKMISEKEEQLDNLELKADSAGLELEKLDVDREVHKKIMAGGKNKQFEYNFSEDYYMMVKGRHEELKGEIVYLELWIKEAQKMIKTKKYKDIPREAFWYIHLDGEVGTFWEDGFDCDCGARHEEFDDYHF